MLRQLKTKIPVFVADSLYDVVSLPTYDGDATWYVFRCERCGKLLMSKKPKEKLTSNYCCLGYFKPDNGRRFDWSTILPYKPRQGSPHGVERNRLV